MRKRDNATGRWFCGHLWEADGTTYSMSKLLTRLAGNDLIQKIGFQIEAGSSNNTLHYQFLICTNKPVRNTQLFKSMNCRKGEFVQKVDNLIAQKNYIKKASTKVEGPWYFRTLESDARCARRVNITVESMHEDTIETLLEAKWQEILMWSDFLGIEHSKSMSHEKSWREIDNPEEQF